MKFIKKIRLILRSMRDANRPNFINALPSFERDIANECITEIIPDKIPGSLNFSERRRWIQHKEKILFDKKSFSRFIVRNHCVWLYTNNDTKPKKWAILEKIKALKLVVSDLSESEIWILDEKDQKICLALLDGKLVNFRLLKDFSNAMLESFVQHMKRYTFEAPKVRLFDCCFDFDYQTESYSKEFIEFKTKLPIDKIKYKYVENYIQLCKIGFVNLLTVLSFAFLLIFLNNQTEKTHLRINEIKSNLDRINKQMSYYPTVSHIKSLQSDSKIQRKMNLKKFTECIKDYQYRLKITAKRIIKLEINGLTTKQKEDIMKVGSESGITEVKFAKVNFTDSAYKLSTHTNIT
ncbi:hypothetical protein FZC35_02850 [Candidatus Cytomitobacter indipagum]|uniref:Uncharacterized protein n=1 Tax=Candidatus Cytomitobacter indipagum TaxID=2601575 RepID=A0A5C0UEZ3_9PROT|nr:hypothetical protein [Candidatus Cytomitobacter indipagum]QEK38287.1 hypothetical protein FZC35_02850 [Candidatus Cytomitobacter indipagum]